MSVTGEIRNQIRFNYLTGLLFSYANAMGYGLTYADTYAKTGHKLNSLHYRRLAGDFNLMKWNDEKQKFDWLKETEDHQFLGEFWESLDEECIWGGMWGDGNHYQYGHG